MRVVLVVFASLALVACGDDDGGGSAPDPAALGDELGCESFEPLETEELYVRELFSCEREEGTTTNVYTFNTSSARDSWREIAEEFGTVVVDEGDTWLEVRP